MTSRFAPGSSWLVSSLLVSSLVACAEAEDTGLPRDPDFVGGSAGMSAGGTPSQSGTANVSGSGAGTPAVGGGGAGAAGASGGGGAASAGESGSGGSGGATGGAAGAGGSGGADACPMDPDKTAPGKCGCGVPDEDSVNGAGCGPLQDSIVHRYSFDTDAKDSVGGKDGTLMQGASVANKALVLSGGASGGYVQLPAGMISALGNATFEAWVTWTGSAGANWQRVFDFGSNDGVNGSKYLFLAPRTFRTAYTSATPKSEVIADASVMFPAATLAQVTVVVNDAGNSLNLYLNGDSVGGTALSLSLSALDDVNNWLGRSQYASDPYFAGTIAEFRIYNAALTGPQVKTAFKMGADTTFLDK